MLSADSLSAYCHWTYDVLLLLLHKIVGSRRGAGFPAQEFLAARLEHLLPLPILVYQTHHDQFARSEARILSLLLESESLPYVFHNDHTILVEHANATNQERRLLNY